MILLDNSSSIAALDTTKALILIQENNALMVIEHLLGNASKLVKVTLLDNLTAFDAGNYTVENTSVYLVNSKVTLLPKFLADAEHQNVAAHNFELGNDTTLKKDVSYDEQLILLHPIAIKTSAFIERISSSNGKHIGCEFIAHLNKTTQDTLLVVVINNTLYLGLQVQNKLQLFNGYAVKNAEEVLYYIMLVAQEFKIDPTVLSVEVAGDFSKSGDLAVQLKNYFVSVTALQHEDCKDVSVSGVLKLLTA